MLTGLVHRKGVEENVARTVIRYSHMLKEIIINKKK